ncbi:MAG TPA: beta-galactosidase [Candidatus Blautia stercoravium]|nr:beta-galactosidase [Candidatus Blautia stercoravium]
MGKTEALDLQRLIPRKARIEEQGKESCVVRFGAEGGGVTFPETRKSRLRYIVGDVEVLEEHSAAMMLRCFLFGEEKERLFLRFGLLPSFKTRICLDLSLLDNRTIYTNRTPGTLKLVVHGQRTPREKVERFELGIKSCYHDVRVRMGNFYMSEEPPREFPTPDKKIVDCFGQWKEKEWPGKIHSEEELKAALSAASGAGGYPFPQWNRWGGDSGRKLKEGTGFFSTFKTPDGRWHLVDPDGCDYFSMGPCGTRPGEEGRVDSFEKNCDWLPKEEDPEYGYFWNCGKRRRAAYMEPEHFRLFSFAGANLKRVYGDEWKEKWEEIAHHILMSNGMNSQGNFPGLCVNRPDSRIPYVRELPDFPSTQVLIFRDFPDVLSREYAENAARYARKLEEWREDPWLIGYFLRNEPEFNFVENLAVVDEVLRNPARTCCREGFYRTMCEKYQRIEALNQVWGSSFASFDALLAPIEKCSTEYPGSEPDVRSYSRFLIREYIRVPSQECRKADPKHLNLGLRWSKADNPDMMAGWEYFDVFSVNCYDFDPGKDMDFIKNAGVDRPILLGEYHCGALDRGLTATGLKGVTDQKERAKMWRSYVERAAAHPYGVGAHWFQFNDQFCLGRFDGENYQIGMVDVCMQPYPELMQAAKETAAVLYQVKNGEREPFAREPEAIPMIGY